MELKVILYILFAVIYFVYSISKKAAEKKNNPVPQKQKTVTPPAAKTLEDILEEIKRTQAKTEPVKIPKPKPASKPVAQQYKGKDILVHEKKKTVFEEGKTNYESVFERDLTDEDKIERGNIKLENKGIYRIETIEEAEARALEEQTSFRLDVRQAIIGSIVFERKF